MAGCSPPAKRPPPNVLLITVDTLRADYVHAYGFSRENTPNIDALAARGVLFERAVAAATLTAPAHASIMTSRYARQHSVGTLNGATRLAGLVTLASRFEQAGYETAAFVSNVVLRRRLGLDRGFETYDDEMQGGELNRRALSERLAQSTVARATAWLGSLSSPQSKEARPFFLWVHLQDPHGPYEPPEPFLGKLGDVPLRMTHSLPVLDSFAGRAGIPSYQALPGIEAPGAYAGRYAEEVMYTDHWIGRLLEAVERSGGERGSVVLLTADHGESMGESGFFFQHGHSATPELAFVPLIVAAPGIAPGRHDVPVSHVDIAPTILELAGLSALENASGVSLVSVALSGSLPDRRDIFCDTQGESAIYSSEGLLRARGGLAAATSSLGSAPLRFEAQRQNANGDWRQDEIRESSVQRLSQYLESQAELVAADVMEPEHIEQLRALGYLPEDRDALLHQSEETERSEQGAR